MVKWINSCFNEDGGFGGNINHDSDIVNTLYGLIILMLLERLDEFLNQNNNKEKIINFVNSLYNKEQKSFKTNVFGEMDSR